MSSYFLWKLYNKRYWFERICTSKSKLLFNELLTKQSTNTNLLLEYFASIHATFISWTLHYLINSLRNWNFHIAIIFISITECDKLPLLNLTPLKFLHLSGCSIHRHWLHGKATRLYDWWRIPWPSSVCWQNKKWGDEIHYCPGQCLYFIFYLSLIILVLLRFLSWTRKEKVFQNMKYIILDCTPKSKYFFL